MFCSPFFYMRTRISLLQRRSVGADPMSRAASAYYVNEKSLRLVDGDPATFYDWVETTKSLERNETLRKHRITMELGGGK